MILALFDALCHLKRNPLGLFTPQSVKEFKRLRNAKGIEMPTTEIGITKHMLKALLKKPIEENISKFIQTQLKQVEAEKEPEFEQKTLYINEISG